jgi:predicted transcriptional regulator
MGAVEYECLEQWCQGAMDYWVDQAETGRHMIDYVEAHRAYLKKLYEMRGF